MTSVSNAKRCQTEYSLPRTEVGVIGDGRVQRELRRQEERTYLNVSPLLQPAPPAEAPVDVNDLRAAARRVSSLSADGWLDLDPEKRSCSTAESEERTPEVREAEFAGQMSALKTERPVDWPGIASDDAQAGAPLILSAQSMSSRMKRSSRSIR
jgi:hypothetical protein